MKISFTIFFICISVGFASAQHADLNKFKIQLASFEDTLKVIGNQIVNGESEPERLNANYTFARTLVRALKTSNSFNYTFDSLKTISIQTSPDRRFRIFSWHVLYNDGSYRYYGTIQMNNPDGKLQMHGLVDYTPVIKNAADTVTDNNTWYGAQYYTIIPVTYNTKIPYYVLLGWKGNTVKTTKKVIDVLYFKDGKPIFGMPVFDGYKEHPQSKRIIFEYSRQVSMLLRYQPKEGLIVFDHIAPRDAKLKGQFETYGPDMTYDGFKLVNGRWQLKEELPLKNPPAEIDNNYNDPKKPPTTTPRKLNEGE